MEVEVYLRSICDRFHRGLSRVPSTVKSRGQGTYFSQYGSHLAPSTEQSMPQMVMSSYSCLFSSTLTLMRCDYG